MAIYRARFNQFNGGISNDEYTGQKGCVYNSVGLEMQKNSREVTLANGIGASTDIGNYSTYGYIMAMIPGICGITKNGYIFRMDTESVGHVYQATTGETTFINLIDFPISAATATQYIIAGQTKIVRFNISSGTVSNVQEISTSLSTPAIDNLNYRPMIIAGDSLYIARGNKVDRVLSTGVVENVLTLNKLDVIKKLHLLGENLVIITQNTQYYRDRVSDLTQARIIYNDVNFINSEIIGNSIFAISRDDSENRLMQLNSYSAEPVVRGQSTALNRINLGTEFGNSTDTKDRMIYIASSDLDGIYTYGDYYPGFSKALNLTHSLGDSRGTTTAIVYPKVAGTKTVSAVLKSSYGTISSLNSTGYVELNPILLEGDGKSEKIRINYSLTHTAQTIKIYTKKDDGSYALIYTIDGTIADHYNKKHVTFMYPSNFSKMQFKVELNAGGGLSPKFRSLLFVYNETLADV